MWLAEVRDGALLRVENGRTRHQVVDHLQDLAAEEDKNLVVGLDFAFSTPACLTIADVEGMANHVQSPVHIRKATVRPFRLQVRIAARPLLQGQLRCALL